MAYCGRCGFAFDAAEPAQTLTPGAPVPNQPGPIPGWTTPPGRPHQQRNVLAAGIGALVVLFALGVIGRLGKASAPAAAWWPAGFSSLSSDPAVAGRWMTTSEMTCRFSTGGCWGMFVVARDGCANSLYVEVSLMDDNRTVVGSTNDGVGTVAPMQQARLEFDTFDRAATRAKFAKVSCY